MTNAYAVNLSLAWDASTGAGVSGYRLYQGSASRTYTSNINVGNQTNYTVTNLTAGQTYYFAVTAYDAQGNQSTFSNEISYTISLSAPIANFSATPTSGRAPLTVNFTNTSTGTVTAWSWNFGNGSTSTAQHPSHTYTTAGTYTVRLTATGPGGSHTVTKTNYISTTVAPIVANFTATPTSGRVPLTVAFSNTTTGSATSWSWSFGNGGTSTAQHPSHTYTTAGTYTVRLTATGPGGSHTVTKTNYISTTVAPIVANFTATPTSGRAPLTVAFSNTTTGSATSWSWSFGNGGTSTAQHPSHTYITAGTYTVRLTATGPGGSHTVTKTSYITVSAPSGSPGLVAAYSFANGSGTTVTDASGTGNHGTITGATWTTQGRFGKALTFDGINDWVSVADAPSLDLSTGMTLEAWVFPTTSTGTRDILIKEGANVDLYNLYARNTFGLPEANAFVGGSNRTAVGAALPANVWTHVAATYDGAAIRLFINGVQVASTASSGSLPPSTGPLRIGGNSLWGEFFQGRIDEVRIYNRALTATAIQTDMQTPVSTSTAAPVANFTGTPPTAVTFSNTTTGTRTKQVWAFGDGATNPAQHPSHTATKTNDISLIPSLGEVGEVQVDHLWKAVTFRQPFIAPIVVANSISRNDSTPATVRIRNVTPSGFEMRVEEWNYLDHLHAVETVGYLVLERGRHTIDGAQVEAGSIQTDWTQSFVPVAFSRPFAAAPVVLTAVVSTVEPTTVITRLRNITAANFQVRMQEQEKTVPSHANGTLTYIAWEPAVGTLGGLHFEAQSTARVMTNTFRTIPFTAPFMNPPVFLAAMQTTYGTRSAAVRWEKRDFFGVDVQLQEEQPQDVAMTHAAEVIGYVAFAPTDGNVDTDGDGLTNVAELQQYGTDPSVADTDHDGIDDGAEVAYWGDNWQLDNDGDGLINLLDPDADADGVLDGEEISGGFDPADPTSRP